MLLIMDYGNYTPPVVVARQIAFALSLYRLYAAETRESGGYEIRSPAIRLLTVLKTPSARKELQGLRKPPEVELTSRQ